MRITFGGVQRFARLILGHPAENARILNAMRRSLPRCFVRALVLAVFAASLSGCAASELQYTTRSPDGVWEVRTYYDNPGAMASSWGHVDLVRVADGSSRELWHGPPLSTEPVWLDNTTVLVGEQRLGVDDEAFDWFEDAPVGGFPTPGEAAVRYVEALARGDLGAVQQASRLIVTQAEMAQRQRETFGSTKRLTLLDVRAEPNNNVQASDQAEFDVYVVIETKAGKKRRLKLDVLVCKEQGAWHAEWAVPWEVVNGQPE